MTINGMKGDDE